ncbi:hypothetical protein C8Q75DRAFT_209493 [Abortiporus biennis]|nr:hypothetical protein C8Q75DRAFT_209493 [Abortiporus biennis]
MVLSRVSLWFRSSAMSQFYFFSKAVPFFHRHIHPVFHGIAISLHAQHLHHHNSYIYFCISFVLIFRGLRLVLISGFLETAVQEACRGDFEMHHHHPQRTVRSNHRRYHILVWRFYFSTRFSLSVPFPTVHSRNTKNTQNGQNHIH